MNRILIWLFVFCVILLGVGYYTVLFQNDNQYGIVCVFNDRLGWLCPGCGGQRAIAAILSGNFIEAFIYNPLIYFYLGLLFYLGVIVIEGYILKNQYIRTRWTLPHNFGYFFLTVVITFTIVRNIL